MDDDRVNIYCEKCYAEYALPTDLGPEYVPEYCAFCGEFIDFLQMQSEMLDYDDDGEPQS